MTTDRHESKRRRLDAVTTLSKPFKSPLRRPSLTENLSQHPPSPLSAPVPEGKQVPASLTTRYNEPQGVPSSSPATSPAVRQHKSAVRSSLSTPARSPLADPELLDLQKQQRSLQSRLINLQAEINTAKQALRIESSTKDSELEALIIKWRLISQEAADEVFAGAQERVARMGGMAAWRERNKRDTTRWDFQEEGQQRADEETMEHISAESDQNPLDLKDDMAQRAEDKQEEAGSARFPFYYWHIAYANGIVGVHYGVHAQYAEHRPQDYRI